MDRVHKLLHGIDLRTAVVAEIGALCRPLLTKAQADIRYIDYADAAQLRAHYAGNPAIEPEKIVETDAIWGNQTLFAALGEQVDYVLASHVVEHVPDLIAWLNEIDAALQTNGQVRLAIPDRRFTFDFLRRETSVSDVVAAHITGAKVPQPISILDYYLNATEVDCAAAWQGLVSENSLRRPENFQTVLGMAVDAFENGTYHDAHCWVFTPHSFAALLEQLGSLRLIHFACDEFFDTEPGSIEFFVSMSRCSDPETVRSSWRRMAASVRQDVPGAPLDLERKVQEVRTEADQARAALEEGRRQIRSLALRVSDLESELARTAEEIRQLRGSRSWRLTRPYRTLGTFWHRIRD